jgi:hypothetical protein
MRYNYKSQSPARWSLKRFPAPNGEGYKLDATISVARVQPRTSTVNPWCTIPRTRLYLNESYRTGIIHEIRLICEPLTFYIKVEYHCCGLIMPDRF